MHDEAAPHYEDMINNMMKGQEFLKETIDNKPRVGWHVDPFGHSSANPALFADMGFEAWMFARLSYDDKIQRLEDQAMNTLWRPFNKHFGNQKQIFTAIMQDHYCWAQGFWYDEREDLTNDDPFVSDQTLSTFNAD
jgi:alpha-mannosidase